MTKLDTVPAFLYKGPACWLVLCIWSTLTFSCGPQEESKPDLPEASQYQQKRLAAYEQTIWPRANRLVTNGDLVLRLGSDITSEMIRQLNQQDASFSHCGIASIEQDTVFIYHAIGGEFNPDQRLKRETLFSFCHPADNKAMAVYRPMINDAQRRDVLSRARQYYFDGVPFDMSFDYNTEDRLYCAEFVAKCFARAMSDSSWFTFTVAGNFRYVSVDNLFASPVMQPMERLQY